MKLKKFESLAKKSNRLVVINIKEENLQYISNGFVFYPMHKLPALSKEMVYALLDIAEEKQETFAVEYHNSIAFDYRDNVEKEEPLTPANFNLIFNERNYAIVPVFTEYGMYYYLPSWLAPFTDENYTLCVRYSDELETPYIVVKTGMLVLGFIALQDFNKNLAQMPNGKEDLMTMYSMLEVDTND